MTGPQGAPKSNMRSSDQDLEDQGDIAADDAEATVVARRAEKAAPKGRNEDDVED
jgi:hypothetical protein